MVDERFEVGEAKSGLSRRTVMKGAAWTVPALMVATAAPAQALSCTPGDWSALGRGKVLSGGLFNIDLDLLASVNGTIASAPTEVSEPGFVHGPGAESDPDIHANPLDVTVLSGINVSATGLTTTVSQLLGLIASAPDGTGLVNQFGHAQSDGLSMGASGYVADNGTVRVAPAGGYPQVASLNLKEFLTPLLGGPTAGFLANVTDLDLEVGAIAGRAILEQMCNTVVTPDGYHLTREYLVAYLRLVLTSPLVGTLVTTVEDAVEAVLESPLNTVVLGALADAVAALVYPLDILTREGQFGLDLSLITGQIPSTPPAPIQLNLGAGTVVVDVFELLGGAFPGGASAMANSLPANSTLFVDYGLPPEAIGDFTGGVVDSLQSILLDAVYLEVRPDSSSPWARYSLRSLQSLPGLGPLVLTPVINLITGVVVGATVTAAITAINTLLQALFDALRDVARITLNVQNDPDANNNPAIPNNGPGPERWATGAQALPAGRYDVAALGLSAVDILAVPDVLDLFLARGSVGPHTEL